MLLSVRARLMSVGKLIGLFVRAHSVEVCDTAISGKTFQSKDIEIKKEGGIEAVEIDERMLVGRQYSIVSKAALEKPTKPNILLQKIQDFFGVDWVEAVEVGKIFDAKDACEKVQIDADAMDGRR